MQSLSFVLVISVICINNGSTLRTNLSTDKSNSSNIVSETTLAVDLNIKPQASIAAARPIRVTNITERHQSIEELPNREAQTNVVPQRVSKDVTKNDVQTGDIDYSFLSDRMPDQPDDEYFDSNDDSTPLHFLKRTTTPLHELQLGNGENPVSPIYITIPIYINTGDKLPLALSVAGHEVPLNAQQMAATRQTNILPHTTQVPPTKAPNSHFNRLLNQFEPPKRRTNNRHRSNLRSKIYARKDRNSSVAFKKFGYYKATHPRG